MREITLTPALSHPRERGQDPSRDKGSVAGRGARPLLHGRMGSTVYGQTNGLRSTPMTLAHNILDGLNAPQREAVETIEGPLLIVAGPGSGKTRVITHRIAYLVRVVGISPRRILAVTFTNRAAREMKDRLQGLVGEGADRLSVGTFHSFCAGVLRRDGKHVGLESSFSIYDDEDQINLVKQAMEQADLDPKRYPPRSVLGVISRAKSVLMDSHALEQYHQSFFEERAASVYQRYEELLSRNNGVDFDDLLLKAVQLLRGHDDVLARYQRRFVHVMIDEFQDTNVAQYALAKLLAGGHRNICVVGDADQSIYSWRHADIRNILSFQKDYPEARVVTLSQNYRSTAPILKAAKQLISTNRMRLDKELWTSESQGHPVVVHELYNEEEEAQFVLAEVARLGKEDGFKAGDCAVMYRVNAQSRALEEACLRYGVQYRLVGGVRFYQRREVKDVIAYLRLIHNPNDDVSLSRVINVPSRGIGRRSMDEIRRWAQGQQLPMYGALLQMSGASAAEGPDPLMSTRTARLASGFVKLLADLAKESRRLSVVDLIDAVLERTDYKAHLQRQDDFEDRWENVLELRNTAQEFREIEPPDGLGMLLERLALVADVDNYQESPDAVTLITLHQAKGLEFPVVFMVGMEEGLLPHSRSRDSAEEVEEERRLCYVGMTRCKERLYLLRSFRRGFMGGNAPSGPSRFLYEIPRDLTASPAPPPPTPRRSPRGMWGPSQASPRPAPDSDGLKTGQKVRHSSFGEGVVVSCVPSDQDYVVTVAFDGAGVKRLMLSYANLVQVE